MIKIRRKIYYLAGLACSLLAAAILIKAGIDFGAGIGLNIVRHAEDTGADNPGQRELIEEIYGVSYKYPKKTPDSVPLYIPEYDYIEPDQSEIYTVFFGFEGEFSEYDDFYLYSGENAELYVYKYINRIILKYYTIKNGTLKSKSTLIDNEVIISIAENFIKESHLPLSYEKISAENFGDGYIVTFLGALSGWLNYAYPVTVTLDSWGNVTELNYYQLSYEKLSAVRVISMKEAYYRLPVPEDYAETSLTIDLNKCELVYYFEDSILQPAYRFEGEIILGGGEAEKFVHYVKAALYQ